MTPVCVCAAASPFAVGGDQFYAAEPERHQRPISAGASHTSMPADG